MLLFDEAIFRCTTTQLLACQIRDIHNACDMPVPYPYLTLKHNGLYYCPQVYQQVLMLTVMYMRDLELAECASYLLMATAHGTKGHEGAQNEMCFKSLRK
jgi:hypothetical protein